MFGSQAWIASVWEKRISAQFHIKESLEAGYIHTHLECFATVSYWFVRVPDNEVHEVAFKAQGYKVWALGSKKIM